MSNKKSKNQRRRDKKTKKAKKRTAPKTQPTQGSHVAPGTATLHYSPSDFDETYTAMLLAQLAHAVELGNKLPGVTGPVHVQIRFGGQQVCGEVELESGSAGAPPVAEA